MATPSRLKNEESIGQDELQALVLSIWEVANRERRIDGLLAAIADVLRDTIPFAAASMISFAPEGTRVLGIYAPKELQSLSVARASVAPLSEVELDIRLIPFNFSNLSRMMAHGKPFTCADLQLRQAWQDYEFDLARLGTRTYALQPLILRRQIIGAAIFSRTKPEPFTLQQLGIMRAASPAMAAALANALDKERAAEKIERLEAENHNLREQISRLDRAPEYATASAACIADELLYLRDRMVDAEPSAQNLAGETVRSSGSSIDAQLQHQERRLIETTLAATHGRVSGPKGAALLLGLPSSTLEFRIQRLAIDKFQFRHKPPKPKGR